MTTKRIKTAAELLGVQDPPRNAKDRLLDKAIDLFYSHGFHAIGLDRIIAETRVTKTTFYKHFESKDDLFIAAIEKRDRWESNAWEKAVIARAGTDPKKMLLAVFDVLDDWFNAPDYKGCIFTNTAIEFSDPADPIHQVAARFKTRNRQKYHALACAANLTDPDAFADRYTTLLEGSLIFRHVHHRNDAARITRPMIETLIISHTPKKSPRKNPR